MKSLKSHSTLARQVKPGKQGLDGQHRSRFIDGADANICSSVDFEAMSAKISGPARVDYLVESSRCLGVMHAVEIHAFKPTDLWEKKQGTLTLLRQLCPGAIPELRTWHVIVQGATPRTDIAARFFAETKIAIAGRNLSVSKLCTKS